jgi:hypothetical protein
VYNTHKDGKLVSIKFESHDIETKISIKFHADRGLEIECDVVAMVRSVPKVGVTIAWIYFCNYGLR